MKIKIRRFGLPYNPAKERREKNRISSHIIVFLCLFIIVAMTLDSWTILLKCDRRIIVKIFVVHTLEAVAMLNFLLYSHHDCILSFTFSQYEHVSRGLRTTWGLSGAWFASP